MAKIQDQFRELLEVSNADIVGCAELLDANQASQVLRRAFVRAVLAAIEGTIYSMKQHALDSHNSKVQFKTEDIALLKEETFGLSDGKAKVSKAKLRLIDNLKFAFRAMAESGFSDYSLDLQARGWNQFQDALKLRDKLMHPKRSPDLIVADEEVENTKAAWLWFLESVNHVVESVVASTKESIALLGEAVTFADAWFKLIKEYDAEQTWKSLSLASKRVKTFDDWKTELDRHKREIGSAVFRTLVFKTRVMNETQPVFRLESLALYVLGGAGRLLIERLTVAREGDLSWKVRSFQLALATGISTSSLVEMDL